MKTCKHCGDIEWPCFFIAERCRMCQARHRDEQRQANTQETAAKELSR